MSARVYSILVEPAGYTMDLIRNVYSFRGVEYSFMYASSLAAKDMIREDAQVFSQMSFIHRILALIGALRRHDAFVVNGYTATVPLLFIWLNVLFFRKPFAIESDTELEIPSGTFKRTIKWGWLHFLFTRKYCYGFAGGNFRHKDLFRYYGMPEDRIILMPMVVDNAMYYGKEADMPHNSFHFGYLGRLVAHKQVDKIIAALPSKCELFVVGEGAERTALEQMANANNVHFLGNLFGEDKVHLLNSLDCLVLYSSYEPWGLVVNEALACGIPVIVSDKVGARKDLVEGDNPTGLVAKWDDVDDLANKMRQMAMNQELYSKCSQNARMRMKHWNYDLYSKNFDAWLKQIKQ